jgi:choline-glycine betaine transporter
MHRTVQLLRSGLDRLFGLRRRASRHDLVLAVIPAAFLVAAVLGTTLSVSATTAVTAAALLSGLAMLDALFFNPPRGPTAGEPPA